MRKLNPRLPIVFLALTACVFISTTLTDQTVAAQTCQENDVPMRDGVTLYTRVFFPDSAVSGSATISNHRLDNPLWSWRIWGARAM